MISTTSKDLLCMTFEQHSTACRFSRSQWKVSLNNHLKSQDALLEGSQDLHIFTIKIITMITVLVKIFICTVKIPVTLNFAQVSTGIWLWCMCWPCNESTKCYWPGRFVFLSFYLFITWLTRLSVHQCCWLVHSPREVENLVAALSPDCGILSMLIITCGVLDPFLENNNFLWTQRLSGYLTLQKGGPRERVRKYIHHTFLCLLRFLSQPKPEAYLGPAAQRAALTLLDEKGIWVHTVHHHPGNSSVTGSQHTAQNAGSLSALEGVNGGNFAYNQLEKG